MNEYTPDRWAIMEIADGDYRVLGTWSSSYLHGSSWQINSGIVSVDETEYYYHFAGTSGSVYRCRKGAYGTTGVGFPTGDSWNVLLEETEWSTIEWNKPDATNGQSAMMAAINQKEPKL